MIFRGFFGRVFGRRRRRSSEAARRVPSFFCFFVFCFFLVFPAFLPWFFWAGPASTILSESSHWCFLFIDSMFLIPTRPPYTLFEHSSLPSYLMHLSFSQPLACSSPRSLVPILELYTYLIFLFNKNVVFIQIRPFFDPSASCWFI
jgi:hypothetical protein